MAQSPSPSRGRVRKFYGTGGARMFERDYLTPEISDFLLAENRVLARFFGRKEYADHLVEVGCGPGLHLEWAIQRRIDYDGIDLVSDLVRLGRKKLKERFPASPARIHVASCDHIDAWWKKFSFHTLRKSPLVFLPFNVLGNMSRPAQSVAALCRTGAPVLVSIFSTNPLATRCRQVYYSQLGYQGLGVKVERFGVLFTSQDGLHSYAPDPVAVGSLFAKRGYHQLSSRSTGPLGRAYLFAPAK